MRISAIICCAFALSGLAQVKVDQPVQLTGNEPAQQQVLGLDPALEPSDALDAATDQRGAAHWAGDATGAAWVLSLDAISGPPSAGFAMVVRTAVPQSGNVTLSVNGHGPYPVVIAPGEPLNGDALPVGTMLSLVFDGAAFQATNGVTHALRPCPEGMVQVGAHFCMEPDERPEGTWFQAAMNCANAGLRLCTWSEWQQACLRRVDLGLNTMISNWEWVNNTANEDGSARVVGNTSCSNAGTFYVTNSAATRCCYSR
jgi:hypothetical protein